MPIQDPWDVISRLPGGDKDPFDRTYGPTLDCFTSNDIVRMFSLGAAERDVAHLNRCRACKNRLDRFSNAKTAPVTKPLAYGRPEPAKAVLYIPDAVPVSASNLVTEPFLITFAAPVDSASVDFNFRLEGAVSATALAADAQRDKDGWVHVTFEKASISNEVAQNLSRHFSLTDQVTLVASSPGCDLVGESNIDFVRRP